MKSRKNLDPSVQEVIDYLIATAREYIHPDTIILFGSRARGDARPKSDYDLAFEFDSKKHSHDWSAFCLEVQENAPTLLPLNLMFVILPFYAFIDMVETAINVWSDACVTAAVDKDLK